MAYLICIQAPIFDPSTTDNSDFYIVEVSNQDGSHSITRNVPASTDPLMITLNDLMKGTIYRARIVAYNDQGVGTFTDFFTAQTRVDCKLLTMLNTKIILCSEFRENIIIVMHGHVYNNINVILTTVVAESNLASSYVWDGIERIQILLYTLTFKFFLSFGSLHLHHNNA